MKVFRLLRGRQSYAEVEQQHFKHFAPPTWKYAHHSIHKIKSRSETEILCVHKLEPDRHGVTIYDQILYNVFFAVVS